MKDIADILRSNGYNVVIGKTEVLRVISDLADTISDPQCSGYGVFPDGTRCKGCEDCATHPA